MVRRIHPGWQLAWEAKGPFEEFHQVPMVGNAVNVRRASCRSRRMLPCGTWNLRRRIPSELWMPRKSRSPQPSGNSNLRGSVRIIAGSLRGRSIPFLVSEATRPMKDKTRGAIFNIIGPSLEGYRVFDLFAGTGILAMESLSRGAISATVVELDHRRAKAIDQAGRTLLLTPKLRVVSADAFAWSERWLKGAQAAPTGEPWVVFFCPPYPLWDADPAQMERLIQLWAQAAPAGSILVAESPERRVDHNLPSDPWQWESRRYPPANVLFGWYPEVPASPTPE